MQITRFLSTAVLGAGKSTQLAFPRSFLEDAARATGHLVEWFTLTQHAKLLIPKNWGGTWECSFVNSSPHSHVCELLIVCPVSGLDYICLRRALFAFLTGSLCTEVYFCGLCPHWEWLPWLWIPSPIQCSSSISKSPPSVGWASGNGTAKYLRSSSSTHLVSYDESHYSSVIYIYIYLHLSVSHKILVQRCFIICI